MCEFTVKYWFFAVVAHIRYRIRNLVSDYPTNQMRRSPAGRDTLPKFDALVAQEKGDRL